MSDIEMATTGDISRAKAHADRGDEKLDSRITDLETKVEDLQKDNAELREALPAAGISVGTEEE